ncbi:response regulator [Marinicrinis lubricantis]|uniref:Response regulator n=1 Tax=Marinicrinis lubricantis TaxID=2086470 RepID=A0ABW1IJQ7_9BACL
MFVDDESIIREGLRTLIRWEDLGFDEFDEAENAVEALRILQTRQPDLIITDIFMPEMSGIEFARQVKALNSSVRLVILTGYEKFEYAKEAVEIGVAKYMVKPIFPSELEETVQEIVRDIYEERSKQKWSEEARSKLAQYQPVIVEKFWSDLVTGMIFKAQDIQKRLQGLNIDIAYPSYSCAAVKVPMKQTVERYGEEDTALIKFAVRNVVEELLHDDLIYIVETDISILQCIVRRELDAAKLDEVIQSIYTLLKLHVWVGVGSCYEAIEDLPRAANEALEAVHALQWMDRSDYMHYQELPHWKKQRADYPYAREKEILDVLRFKGHVDARVLTPFLEALEQHPASSQMKKLMLFQLLGGFYRIVDEYDAAGQIPSFYESCMRLTELDAGAEIVHFFHELFHQFVEYKNKKQSSFVDQLVDQAQKMMKERYRDPELTVATIAQTLCITPNYLSRIFHQKTGVTCVEYMTTLKLEEAQQLLAHTSLKSYEIAEKVGYMNSHYFSTLFKKHLGCSPSEFREKQGQGVR